MYNRPGYAADAAHIFYMWHDWIIGNFYVQVLIEFMFVTLDYRKRFLAWL